MLRFTALAVCCALALGACSQKDSAQPAGSASGVMASAKIEGPSVTVKTTRGEAAVPQNPERVAVYDFGMLDTLNKLGVPTGMSVDKNLLPYLDAYFKQTKPAGTLFEPDYEALNAYKPQLVIIGSRTAKAFDQLSRIAPTIEMTADTAHLKDSAKERIDALAQIFGKQAEADKLKAEIDASFEAAKAADSSIKEKGNHGQPVTFEYIKKTIPDWLFVLDRSAAIGEEGKAAKDVLDNPLVAETTAWKKGQVVYLPPETYLAAGGAQKLLNASKQVTEAFNAAK